MSIAFNIDLPALRKAAELAAERKEQFKEWQHRVACVINKKPGVGEDTDALVEYVLDFVKHVVENGASVNERNPAVVTIGEPDIYRPIVMPSPDTPKLETLSSVCQQVYAILEKVGLSPRIKWMWYAGPSIDGGEFQLFVQF